MNAAAPSRAKIEPLPPDALRQPQGATARPASRRYPLLDLLRVVAILDILSIHINGFYVLRGAGLPMFIIISVALAVRREEPPGLGEVARSRAERVLMPWVVWSGFFGVGQLYYWWTRPGMALAEAFPPWMLVAGTSIHLWFLPFIFGAELVAVGAVHQLRRVPTGWVVAVFLGLAIVSVIGTGLIYDRWEAAGVLAGRDVSKSWLFGTASVCLGLAVGRTLSIEPGPGYGEKRRVTPCRVLLVAAVGAFIISLILPRLASLQTQAVWQWSRQATAFVLIAIAVQVTGSAPRPLLRLAMLTMGIYLLHGWVHARLYDQLLSHVWDRVPYLYATLTPPLPRLIVAWCATAAVVAWLRRWAIVRRVI